MKLRLTTITLLLSLSLCACSKDHKIATSSGTVQETQDSQDISETTEQAKGSNTQTDVPIQTEETADSATNTSASSDSTMVTKNDPIIMETPSFAYYSSEHTNMQETPAIALEMISSESNNITDTDSWFEQNKLSLNQYQCFDKTSFHLPSQLDTMYNNLILTNAFYDDAYIYCTYGTNYSDSYILKIYDVNTNEVVYTLDFSNYMYAPDSNSGETLDFPQQITWATIKDGILYISNRHRTYASTTNNKNAYITAIDLKDMNIVWRSDALISNAENFLILDNVILCGYGFTDEDDYLYELDRNNGNVINSIPLKSAPSYMIQKENQIFVRTYNTNYIFNIVNE